jgi:hypothetical protein
MIVLDNPVESSYSQDYLNTEVLRKVECLGFLNQVVFFSNFSYHPKG